MGAMPGPRTHPTVKPMATMNKRNLQHWELRLGVAQVVVLLGMVTGSIACAFYVGFSSGRGVGFESALERSLAHSARFAVGGEKQAEYSDSAKEVYAKLNTVTKSSIPGAAGSDTNREPVLGTIKSMESASENEDAAGFKKDDTEALSDHISAKFGSDSSVDSKAAALSMDALFPSSGEKVGAKNAIADFKVEAKEEKSKVLTKTDVAQSDRSTSKEIIKSLDQVKQTSAKLASAKEKTGAAFPARSADSPAKVSKQVEVASSSRQSDKVSSTKSNSLVKEKLPPGWFAQVAAPRKMQDATSLAGKLKSFGFPVLIEVARVNGEEYFRVIVGPEQSRQHADRLVGQLKRESYIQGDPFVKLVKK